MGRFMALRALLMALVTAAIAPGSAFGTQPIHVHDRITASFAAEFCGIPVEVDSTEHINVLIDSDGTFKELSVFHHMFTNPDNGQSVLVSATGQLIAPAPTIDEQARTLTVISTFRGLPGQIRLLHGPVLLRDAGIIQFTTVHDLDTLEVISSEIDFVRGPHPDPESGFTLFCDVISAALQ